MLFRSVYRAIPLFENALSPDVEQESWASFAKLGVTPGLLGVVVLDPQTSGYEQSQGTSRSVSSSVILPRHFGYSTSMRSAFLRQIGADPIDLVPTQCLSSVSVNPFFFADYELMGYPRDSRTETDEAVIAPFAEQWNSFRANKMIEGLKRLSNSILSKFKVPIWADLILNLSNRPMTDIIPITAYRTVEGFEYDAGDAGIPFGAQYATPLSVRFIVDPALPETPNTEMMLKLMSQADMRKRKFSICYDLSKLKVEDVTKFLDKWFEPQNP